ncbi:hypothetical protein [Actinotalea soli]|nr:hypothetical protein [Actinotalea soli]
MNRTTKIVSTALLTLGLAVVGLPVPGDAVTVTAIGSTGCCKQ